MSQQTLLSQRRRPHGQFINREPRTAKHWATHLSPLGALKEWRTQASNEGQHPHPAIEQKLPAPVYGSVWLSSAGHSNPNQLSPLVLHAIGVADAVIHDPEVPSRILDLVKPPRYREAAEPRRALDRAIKLAEDGWRVLWLVGSPVLETAIGTAATFSERGIPFHVALSADEMSAVGLAPMLDRGALLPDWTAPDRRTVLLASPAALASATKPRQPPVAFSMSGLAG